MEEERYLYKEIKSKAFDLGILKPAIPDYVVDNLKHDLWYWQKEGLENFLIYEQIRKIESSNNPCHLMFNMATGTGKTLIMAALILYYYQKGYKHFLFFVNQNNIVDKTENNFIDKNHTKYLFKQNVVINDRTISIRKVETFDDNDDIQIKFTSIHKLHNAVYLDRENTVTLEELQKRDLVMIGDEAHHFNASTIRNGQIEMDIPSILNESASEEKVEKSWEDTVINKILGKGKNIQDTVNKNVLLEFTATIPTNPDVIEKYRTKTIYKFELIDFLKAGYTKEINLVSTSLDKKEKILLALLFNWYRHQIALKNNIPNFKPVILFRSKFIEDSKKDYEEFKQLLQDLNSNDFNFLQNVENSIREDQASMFNLYEQGKSRLKQMLSFIKDEDIQTHDIVSFIKTEFTERNCIITNSKDNEAATKEKTSVEQEQLLNSLEDKNNHIRAIFTVKRLTEGWDVLNLFDIVRLYEGRDEGHTDGQRVAGQATIQEIQLIGRGVRYYPFEYNDQEVGKRKFDDDLENPMRVLEELYYHSDDDVRYLDELKRELKNRGFIKENRVIKSFGLKKDFENSDFYKNVKIWKNEREENPEKKKSTLEELKKDFIFEYTHDYFNVIEQQINLEGREDEVLIETTGNERQTLSVKLSDFEKHLIYKAINIKAQKDLSLLRFENLHEYLSINSMDDLFTEEFLGDFKINIVVPIFINSLENIDNHTKLDILLDFFELFVNKTKEYNNPYLGSDFKAQSLKDVFSKAKEKVINTTEYDTSLEDTAPQNDWFVLNRFIGTYEETSFYKYFENKLGNLKNKYTEVYLLRNEEVYLIYDFETGKGFAPDFLLFLHNDNEDEYYQVFIEPKGKNLIEQDIWKQDFMEKIYEKYGKYKILNFSDKKYRIIGIPFYNSQDENNFDGYFTSRVL